MACVLDDHRLVRSFATGSAAWMDEKSAWAWSIVTSGARRPSPRRKWLERLGDGERALAVGHSPTNEAAVLGLTGTMIDPMGKGDGVVVIEENGTYRVDSPG